MTTTSLQSIEAEIKALEGVIASANSCFSLCMGRKFRVVGLEEGHTESLMSCNDMMQRIDTLSLKFISYVLPKLREIESDAKERVSVEQLEELNQEKRVLDKLSLCIKELEEKDKEGESDFSRWNGSCFVKFCIRVSRTVGNSQYNRNDALKRCRETIATINEKMKAVVRKQYEDYIHQNLRKLADMERESNKIKDKIVEETLTAASNDPSLVQKQKVERDQKLANFIQERVKIEAMGKLFDNLKEKFHLFQK